MQLVPIPYSFASKHVDLSWEDIFWGYEHGLIGWSGVVDYAIDRVAAGSNEPAEIELASLTKSDAWRVGELLKKIVPLVSDEKQMTAKGKWLYLTLAWLFENRFSCSDPLGQVEVIYANFDYPHEIESFVRYMPPADGHDPTAQSHAENERRLLENWQRYLHAAESKYKTRSF